MKINISETTILLILVIILVVFYSSNATSTPKKHIKKYIHKRKQLGSVVGKHGGLVVSSPEINVRTRGPEMNYQQQGILYKENNDGTNPTHLTLYGRQTYPGSNKWEYLVGDKSLDDVKIPLGEKKNEVQDGDDINVLGFGEYKVKQYPNDELKYLPY